MGLCAVVQATIVSDEQHSDGVHVPANALTLLVLHVLWLGFGGQAPVIASYLQSRADNGVFWQTLHGYTAWIITPVTDVLTAGQIGRPDLQVLVMTYYMQWLRRVKNPSLIDAALQVLQSRPMHCNTWTGLWQVVKKWLHNDGIQAASHVKHAGVVSCQKAVPATFIINNCGGVALAKRDRIYLLMRLLWDPEHGCAGKPLPPDWPDIFSELREIQPFLFDFSIPSPQVAFDELPTITEAGSRSSQPS